METLEIGSLNVLVAEPSSTQFRIISNHLGELGIRQVERAKTGDEALTAMRQDPPDLIVSAMHFSDLTGTALVQTMRADSALEDIPFMLISSETDVRLLDPIRQAGVIALLPKPFEPESLSRALMTTLDFIEPDRTQLDEHAPEDLEVLIVDDSLTARKHIRKVLTNMGLEKFHEAKNGKEASELVSRHFFDLIVTDYNMPEMDGRELVNYIRKESSQASIPILMVTSEPNNSRLASIQQEGVSAVCDKPFEPREVKQLLEKILTAQLST